MYRRQFPKAGDTHGQWQTVTVDFVPGVLAPGQADRPAYDLRWIRLDLYGYWPVGRMYIREATLKLVEEPTPSSATAPADGSSRPAR